MNEITNILNHQKPLCITGNRQMFMRVFIQEILDNDPECQNHILLVMPNQKAIQSILTVIKTAFSQDACPQIAVATPTELEAWLMAAPNCHTAQWNACIFWLENAQFEDLTLEYIFQICDQIPLQKDTYPAFYMPTALAEPFKTRCPYELECITFADNMACHTPTVFYFSDYGDPARILPETFWKRCQSTQSLVAIRTENHKLRYAESSHRAHIQVQSCDENQNSKSKSSKTLQHLTTTPDSIYTRLEGNWRHLAIIDPLPNTDLTEAAKTLLPLAPILQKPHLSYLVTNRFALLNVLANHTTELAKTQPIPTEFVQIYALYAKLYHAQILPLTSLTDPQKTALHFWAQSGFITISQKTCALTPKGRQLFPGIQRFTDLGCLHSWRQNTVCESPNHQTLGEIPTDFLRLPISQRFSFCLQPTQRLFHNLLGNSAILRVNTDPVQSAWLDAMPVSCTYAQTQRIQNILYANGYPHQDLELDDACQKKLAQTQADFANMPTQFIETTAHEAHLWTFAGAQNNAITAQILNLLAPKLRISFGNCHLRLAWTKSATSTQEQISQRLKNLSHHLCTWANALQEQTSMLPDHQEHSQKLKIQWQKTHLYGWLFHLLPPNMIQAQFDLEMMQWAKSFTNQALPILEVKALRSIDPALKLHFEPQEDQEIPKSPNSKPTAAKTQAPSPCSKPSLDGFTAPCRISSQNSSTKCKHGIKHTQAPWFYIDDNKTLNLALNIMLKQHYIGLDVETTLHDQRLCLIQIGCAEQTFIIDPLSIDISPLAQVFNHPNIIKIIHNASFEKRVLGKLGFQLEPVIDTLSVSRKRHGMKAPGGHSLKAVCQREFQLDMDKECQQSRWDRRPLSPTQLEYAALDAEILIQLYRLYFGKQTQIPEI